MERLTADNPQDNIQTALNLFYIKDGWTWVMGGGPAPEYHDVSLCDYVRSVVKAHIQDADIPSDDNELSCLMAEWLFDGTNTAEGLIATLYTAGWAFAELRHRLKAYEDTGLEPEEIREVQAAMAPIPFGRFRDIMEAERAGRLVVLPCKVGDTVYIPNIANCSREAIAARVQGISISVSGRTILRFGGYPFESAWGDGCGKDWFLTREEEERALEGGVNHDD